MLFVSIAIITSPAIAKISVYVDEEEINFIDQEPVIVKDRTLVPKYSELYESIVVPEFVDIISIDKNVKEVLFKIQETSNLDDTNLDDTN